MCDEMFYNLINIAALALTDILVDCDEDSQEVRVCRHEEIPDRVLIIQYLEELSLYTCELVSQLVWIPVEIT